jgi:Ca2+-binding EF-hand superfamily protein
LAEVDRNTDGSIDFQEFSTVVDARARSATVSAVQKLS